MTGRAWAWFGVVSVLWGIPYLLIAEALDAGLSHGAVAFLRVAIAATLLLPVALAAGRLRPLRGRGRPLLLAAVLGIALPFLLISTAERTVDSGLAGVLVATEPMFIAALTPLLLPGMGGERVTRGAPPAWRSAWPESRPCSASTRAGRARSGVRRSCSWPASSTPAR